MMRAWSLFAASSVLAVVACGGTAIVDPPDDDGTGGSGTGTGTGTGTSTGTGTGTGTGSGTGTGTGTGTGADPLLVACTETCDALAGCGSDVAGCAGGCASTGASCQELHLAMLECYQKQLTDACFFDPNFACAENLFEFLDCRDALPEDGFCEFPGPNACACGIQDEQGNLYENFCAGETCDCLVNGGYVGSCVQDPSTNEVCDPFVGCCAATLYVSSPP